jgi:hypothetical protein
LITLSQAVGGKQPKKKFKEIIIDECDPDKLKISDPDDGEKLYFGPPVDKKALYSSINLPMEETEKTQK